MRKALTFAALDRFLAGLGFVITTIPNSHTLYEHGESGSVLLLPLHRPRDLVDPVTWVAVRKTLADNGLTEPDEFDRLLQKPRRERAGQ